MSMQETPPPGLPDEPDEPVATVVELTPLAHPSLGDPRPADMVESAARPRPDRARVRRIVSRSVIGVLVVALGTMISTTVHYRGSAQHYETTSNHWHARARSLSTSLASAHHQIADLDTQVQSLQSQLGASQAHAAACASATSAADTLIADEGTMLQLAGQTMTVMNEGYTAIVAYDFVDAQTAIDQLDSLKGEIQTASDKATTDKAAYQQAQATCSGGGGTTV